MAVRDFLEVEDTMDKCAWKRYCQILGRSNDNDANPIQITITSKIDTVDIE